MITFVHLIVLVLDGLLVHLANFIESLTIGQFSIVVEFSPRVLRGKLLLLKPVHTCDETLSSRQILDPLVSFLLFLHNFHNPRLDLGLLVVNLFAVDNRLHHVRICRDSDR